MVSAYGFGVIGKIIGPLGLALIVGSSNYLKPDVPLPQIPVAFLYLGCWFLMAGTVYCFFGIETRGKSIEQIDRELRRKTCRSADCSTSRSNPRILSVQRNFTAACSGLRTATDRRSIFLVTGFTPAGRPRCT